MTKMILDRLDRKIYDALTATDSRPVQVLVLIINHYPDRIEDILYRILRIHREIVREESNDQLG